MFVILSKLLPLFVYPLGLAEKLKDSRMTIQRVVERLSMQGYLERRSSSSTLVCEPKVIRSFFPRSVQSITRQIQGK